MPTAPSPGIDTDFDAPPCTEAVVLYTSPLDINSSYAITFRGTAEASCEERPPARVPPWVPKRPWWQR